MGRVRLAAPAPRVESLAPQLGIIDNAIYPIEAPASAGPTSIDTPNIAP